MPPPRRRFVKKNSDAWEMDFDKRFLRKPVGGHIAIAQYYSAENNGKHPAMQFKVFRIYALYIEIESYMGEEKKIKLRFVKFPSGI